MTLWHLPGQRSALGADRIAEGDEIGTVAAFVARLDGEELALRARRRRHGRATSGTGSTWNAFGRATDGALAGAAAAPASSTSTRSGSPGSPSSPTPTWSRREGRPLQESPADRGLMRLSGRCTPAADDESRLPRPSCHASVAAADPAGRWWPRHPDRGRRWSARPRGAATVSSSDATDPADTRPVPDPDVWCMREVDIFADLAETEMAADRRGRTDAPLRRRRAAAQPAAAQRDALHPQAGPGPDLPALRGRPRADHRDPLPRHDLRRDGGRGSVDARQLRRGAGRGHRVRDEPRTTYTGCCSPTPASRARISEILGRRLAALEQRLSDAVFKSVPQRVAETLLTLATQRSLGRRAGRAGHPRAARRAGRHLPRDHHQGARRAGRARPGRAGPWPHHRARPRSACALTPAGPDGSARAEPRRIAPGPSWRFRATAGAGSASRRPPRARPGRRPASSQSARQPRRPGRRASTVQRHAEQHRSGRPPRRPPGPSGRRPPRPRAARRGSRPARADRTSRGTAASRAGSASAASATSTGSSRTTRQRAHGVRRRAPGDLVEHRPHQHRAEDQERGDGEQLALVLGEVLHVLAVPARDVAEGQARGEGGDEAVAAQQHRPGVRRCHDAPARPAGGRRPRRPRLRARRSSSQPPSSPAASADTDAEADLGSAPGSTTRRRPAGRRPRRPRPPGAR